MSIKSRRRKSTHITEYSNKEVKTVTKRVKCVHEEKKTFSLIKEENHQVAEIQNSPHLSGHENDEIQKQLLNITEKDNLDHFFDDFQCPICWEMVNTCHVVNPCGHIFCQNCINEWLKIKPICPCCQQRILSTTFSRQIYALIQRLAEFKKFSDDTCSSILRQHETCPDIIQSIRLPVSSLKVFCSLLHTLNHNRITTTSDTEAKQQQDQNTIDATINSFRATLQPFQIMRNSMTQANDCIISPINNNNSNNNNNLVNQSDDSLQLQTSNTVTTETTSTV